MDLAGDTEINKFVITIFDRVIALLSIMVCFQLYRVSNEMLCVVSDFIPFTGEFCVTLARCHVLNESD